MAYFDWNEEKNQKLKLEREISFEEVMAAIEEGKLITVVKHPNAEKHPNQHILIVNINNYAYVVPCLITEEKIFLKTIYPSREATKKYLVDKK